MRVARYIRVSREDQRPGLQFDETAEFIRRRGWELADTFHDQGISGSKARRPELDRLLDACRRRKVDAVVVYKADRLFRSLGHMVATLDEFAALGVEFISVTEAFDTTTPSGKLLLRLVASLSEFERDLLVERTKAGLAAARRRGKRIGRPRRRFDIEKARELQAEGASLASIGKQLRVSASTLCRALKTASATEGEIQGEG